MAVLDGLRVLQLGPGLAAAVCGRMFADTGARVGRADADNSTPLAAYLNRGLDHVERLKADVIVCEGSPSVLRRAGHDVESLRRINPRAAIVLISPYGQTGPRAEDPASDLTLLFDSGIARMLTGQVDDLSEPPMRAIGQQSAFIGGLAAACAGMHAALSGTGIVVDVSIQEALATLAMTELTRAGLTGQSWSRKCLSDGNGATVCILPASDGFAAISPREERQWAAWLEAMGCPKWGNEARFATKPGRVANWDALHALMSAWSRVRTKREIAALAQAAHVPSFPLCEPMEHLESAQLRHRGFFQSATVAGRSVHVPGPPFGLTLAASDPGRVSEAGEPAAGTERFPVAKPALPLAGIRVLDFSWVIAGPTATRYLAAMGAEVIKIEAPGRGDPGRASELHTVLGQAKKAIVLDLKKPAAVEIARSLAARSDVLVENFATGVMDRLGLGAEALRAINPRLIYVSASGLGRTGPESHAVAYGTLLQCYAGFAGLNRHPGAPPRVGMAWLDSMCGLMLAFITAAAIWRRRSGVTARVDFSMIEAMLWTMAEPLLAEQLGDTARPADKVYRCFGEDGWLAVDGAGHEATTEFGRTDASFESGTLARALRQRGIAAAAAMDSGGLLADTHLQARGFWQAQGAAAMPGLPWVASCQQAVGDAPALGADTGAVLRTVLGLTTEQIESLHRAGAIR